jgi:sugar lactone lactonase YvrE
MHASSRHHVAIAGLVAASVLLLPALRVDDAQARSNDGPPQNAPHDHAVLEIDGAPIVARIEVPVERPRRVLLDGSGRLVVVDSGAGRVARIDAGGGRSVIADGLEEPAGIAIDGPGSIYIACHAGGQEGRGSIVRISPTGRVATLAQGLTGPGALAVDAGGRLFVGLFESDEIAAVDRDGRITTFARNVAAPAGLVFDHDDLLVVSSTEGTLSRITPDGTVRVVARGLQFPTDVVLTSQGRAVVANYAGRALTEIDITGEPRPFASLPPGTIGLAVDPDDNLYVANWDLRLVLHVTMQISIRCPHCDQRIPVRIRPRPSEPAQDVF